MRRLADRVSAGRTGYSVPVAGAATLTRTQRLAEIEAEVATPMRNAYWEISWSGKDAVKSGYMGSIVDEPVLRDRLTVWF